MELTPKAQSVELIRQSQNILILTHTDPDGDALGSVLALRMVLQRLGKKVDAVLDGLVPTSLSYLPGYTEVKDKTITPSNDLIITIDSRSTGEELKLGYKKIVDEHRIQIVITPPKGALMPEDVKVERSLPKYDAVIVLDCTGFDRIGPIYNEFPDLFFETPTVSIDHHVTNSYAAKVNWVDMTATSTAEMLVALIEALGRGENLLDEEVATCLLTGLITDTGSFQNMSTTPKSLTVAAQLVAAGAKHQEIIERISSKSLTTLKLWGRALAKIQENKDLRYVWTELASSDFADLGLPEGDDGSLIDELLKSATDVDFVFILKETDEGIKGSMRSVAKDFDVARLAALFGGGGHKVAAGFRVEGDLESTRGEILTKIDATLQAAPVLVTPIIAPTS
ncbi:MAG: Phosphoesterase RecJ domain protein [Berkelbacteria bacterium GW2011_GWA2_46_7]|uniref:Phosphoesterase RecJ domain protein n=1 Tax=Berkelbacteria bacterium GW2011_GWA2_46_7 TaxID=1618335 RepID=A0A0G1TGA9_9BACT|nr:MAG: Phosphoesterase RecJ domain protein [Berkelbacteria bacterium GW2011_GWA2_46_7]